MHIAITGATGFLGRYLVNHLAARGHRLNIPAGTAVRFEPGQDTRVVVNAVPDGARGLRVESVQSVSHFPGFH